MQATILLFALAREKAGSSTLSVVLPANPTIGDLKAALALACPSLAGLIPSSRIAVDSEYVEDDRQPIPPASELALIPPVSGGSPEDPSDLANS